MPHALVISPKAYVDLIRLTVTDPFERLRLLFNAGCRGTELR